MKSLKVLQEEVKAGTAPQSAMQLIPHQQCHPPGSKNKNKKTLVVRAQSNKPNNLHMPTQEKIVILCKHQQLSALLHLDTFHIDSIDM